MRNFQDVPIPPPAVLRSAELFSRWKWKASADFPRNFTCRAHSHNHPCRFFSKLMFRRHELREFGRKQRVTDPASVITPFRWPCSLNHADDQWCWMILKRLKHHVDRINSKIKEILKNIVINTIKMNQYSMKNYRDFKML